MSFFEIKKILSLFTQSIPLGLVIIVILGLLVMRQNRIYGVLIAGIAGLLLAASSPTASRAMTQTLENQFQVLALPPPETQYIAVFSGGAHREVEREPSIALSPEQMARLTEAIRLWKLNPDATLITTGAKFKRTTSSAEAMATIAQWLGVPNKQIIRLDTVRDTKQEITEIAKLVDSAPIVLVSSAIHLPRISMLASHANLNASYAPSHWQSTHAAWWGFSSERLFHIDRVLHEFFGMLWYRLTLE